jgi:SNF2 family DNA or RNA helicase
MMQAEIPESRPLYHPPWHVPYQLDLAARAEALRRCALIADPGTGKTSVAFAVACYCIGTGERDILLVVCEKAKLPDWKEEAAKFTDLGPVLAYAGTGRDAKLAASGAQVVITSWETARESLVRRVPGKKRTLENGPLLDWLAARRPVVVWDEASAKLKNRSSALYKAHARSVKVLGADPGLRLLALTGTPLERDYETAYNMLRLTGPDGYMPLVKEFDGFIQYRDDYGRPKFRRELMPEFAARAAPRILRKRKTDPDVRDQFPPKTEIFETVEMHSDQMQLYRKCEDLAWKNGVPQQVPGLFLVLRMLAGHPAAVLRGKSALSRIMAEEIGPLLRGSSSAKTEFLVSYLTQSLDCDLKSVVFTFFGQTVLPVLAEELRRNGMPVFAVHGGMSAADQHEERQQFRRADGGAVLVSSDAGSRGVNLPEAASVTEYESGLSSAVRTQRFDRAHRLGRGEIPLTCLTLALEGTCEIPLLSSALDRNAQQDVLLGDDSDEARADGLVTAETRKWLFSCSRKRPR